MPLPSDADRLSLALAAADLGDWSWDVRSDVVTFSDRAAAIFQIPPGPHMTWTAMRALLHPDDAERARLRVEHAIATRSDYRTEYRLVNGAAIRWVAASGRALYDESGTVTAMLGIVQDITERVHIEESLRRQTVAVLASEERYRAFINNSSEGIWRIEFDPPIDTSLPVDRQIDLIYARGRFAECNQVMAAMYGLRSPEALIGKSLDFMMPATIPEARAYLAAIIAAGYSASEVESEERDANGAVKYFSNSMTGVVVDGHLHRAWGTQRSIDDRKRAERTQAWFATTLESITDAFCAFDDEWRFTYVNRQAEVLLGRGRDTLLGRNHWQEYPDTVGTAVEHTYRRAAAEKTTLALEFFYEPHDRWYDLQVYPADAGILVYFRDVNERKTQEVALRDSEHRFRQLADAMPQIVWTADAGGRIDYLNRRWTEFTGMPDTIGNEGWSSLLHPEDAPAARARWAESTRSGESFEMPIRLRDRRNDSYRWHLIRTVAVRDDAGRVSRWFGTATDIHQQKSAEASLRYLAEASAQLGDVTDYEATLQRVAASSVPFFADWSAVDLLEAGGLRRLAVAHQEPAKIAIANELMRDYPPDPDQPQGMHGVLRTGHPVIVSGITDEMLTQGARDDRHLALLRALGLRSYICVPLLASGEIIGLLTFATAESGRVYSHDDLALAIDLGRRAAIAVQNTKLYEALRQADRRKDEFLATLAHELRNPLAPIRNALEILKMPRVAPDTLERARAMMERQVHHVVRLVDDLLDVSRVMGGKIELRREPIELAAAVARAVETVQPLIESQRHELSISLPAESLLIEADLVRLSQVISNLLTNAAKYTDPGGRIAVDAVRDGDEVVLRVADNGIGIEPLMQARIFDLFMQVDHATTRSQGGLGVGLTLAKNLVEMHRGTIAAHSAGAGTGTELIVRLPLLPHQQPPDTPSGAAVAVEPPGGVRVLVVDDNHDAAETFALLLRARGHDVRVAYSGPAALEAVNHYVPDAVFLDIGMPVMDGYEVARRIRHHAELKDVLLVALTGWGQNEDRRRSAESGFDHHMVKPPELETVEALLRSRQDSTRERPTKET